MAVAPSANGQGVPSGGEGQRVGLRDLESIGANTAAIASAMASAAADAASDNPSQIHSPLIGGRDERDLPRQGGVPAYGSP